jgi:hypothetical protein
MKERPLALEDPVHERADGFGDGQNQQKINYDQKDAESSHLTTSKFFRPHKRVHQVHEQSRCDDSRDYVFHGYPLKTIGRLGKSPKQRDTIKKRS